MIRVLYLSTSARVGGAEESLLTLLEHLDSSRVEARLGCPASLPAAAAADLATKTPASGVPGSAPEDESASREPDGSPLSADALPEGSLADRAARINVPVIDLPLRRLRRTVNPFRLWRVWRQLKVSRQQVAECVAAHQVDLIHANSPAAALQAAGAPLLCHLRDLRLPGLAARALRPRLALVIATSQAVAGCARARLGIPMRRIPNGVADRFHPQAGAKAEPPYLLMASHFVPWKRHDLFLQCLAEVRHERPQVRGVIAGCDLFGEHSRYERRLRSLARRLDLEAHLDWAGCVPTGEMPALLSGAAALVHPAPAEPFGRAVLEAMACATPVVAVNAAGPRELLAQGGGTLAPAGDARALARAALGYLQDPAQARVHGEQGRQAAREKYSATQHARTLERVYAELAGG